MSLETCPLTWELDSLLPHPATEEFGEIFTNYRKLAKQLATQSETLPELGNQQKECIATWSDFLTGYEHLSRISEDLESLIACHAAADSENKLFHSLEAQLSALEPLHQQIATNIEFTLKESTDEQFDNFIQADPKLESIRFYLSERRQHARFRLPKDQELLAAELAVDGLHAWGRLYDRISSELRVETMQRGEIVLQSMGQVSFDSPQRTTRENNFFAANRSWNTIADTSANAINHIAGTRLTLYQRLGLQDHLELPCRLNRIQRNTLDTMWSVVSARKNCLLPYLKAKATAMGLERLAWYDIEAPYPMTGPATDHHIPYKQACEHIVQAFDQFSLELGDFARRAIQDGWIESENRSGKRQGGFCTDFPTRQQSRIFMTYTNSTESMSTLAHEIGHAYHSYVLRDQPLFLQQYPYNLAETASTFAEAVLGEQRLATAKSRADRLTILDTMLTDAVTFLMNLHARFVFEDNFHRERSQGEVVPERISEMMRSAQQMTYLDALDDEGWNPSFWISKLHFYMSYFPFYNFPYTFGYLLSLGIYALGTTGGSDFPQQYRQFLKATGCQQSESAMASSFEYDLTEVEFWEMSMDIVADRVNQFLTLAEQPFD